MTFADTTTSIRQLQEQVTGRVITPEDDGYDQTRRGFNLTIDHHPALILVAENAQDIAAGIRFAADNASAIAGIAIQSTGHGQHMAADGALLIVTSRMKDVHINADTRIARIEAGVIWEQVVNAAAPHGLAPLLGSSPHVGVVGYSLGGGIGWLARKYGLAADSIRSIDLVTLDGELRHTSATENSDLFWGLRGGKGNFGVVTDMEIELFPVAKLYGGDIAYPGEAAADALRFFRSWTSEAPDELTSSIAVMKLPNLPEVPEPMRGKNLVIVRAAYVGAAEDGAALIQKWLDWRIPMSNSFHEMPFSEIATISKDPTEPVSTHYSNELLNQLSDDAIDVIVRTMTNSASPLLITELRHASGAIARVDKNASAIGNRDAQFYMTMAGFAPTLEAKDNVMVAIRQYKAELHPFLGGGVYLNFLLGEEAERRAKDAYSPESYARLLALKAKYDPKNLLRYSYHLVASAS